MLDAAREAVSFTSGRARANLDDDRQLVLALVKDVEIVGEAANAVDEATRAELPHIPWQGLPPEADRTWPCRIAAAGRRCGRRPAP